MLEALLRLFPEHAYPLILAHDPDGLLNEESILAALNERSFTLIHETDPVHLRYRVEKAKPFSIDNPIIIRTESRLNTLPYDLWQQGHHVSLGLHTFFPNLAYPILQQLTPNQIWTLSQSDAPEKRLGQRKSMEFVLKHVFELDLSTVNTVEDWVIWLNTYHQNWVSLPELLFDFVLQHTVTKIIPDLGSLITNKDNFNQFLQNEWSKFITSHTVKEPSAQYLVDFANSPKLQIQIGNIISTGLLSPVEAPEPQKLPHWALAGVFTSDDDPNELRLEEIKKHLGTISQTDLAAYRWEQWQSLAKIWAEFTALSQVQSFGDSNEKLLSKKINKAFLEWLNAHYSPLATKKLPKPHHLFHVPHYIAYQRRKENQEKVVMLIMDGMALADWVFIRSTWQDRNPNWQLKEDSILAQIPTITAISRQALVSGLRPTDFVDTLRDNKSESKQWSTFWQNEGVVEKSSIYERHRPKSENEWINTPRLEVVCLIDNTIDDIIHNTTLGLEEFYASLQVWLDNDSHSLENTINDLLNSGFTIYLTSDHGHVDASGFGVISEGLTVFARGKRARVYNDKNFAEQNYQKVAPATIWSNDGLLPENIYALIPEEQHAFVPHDEIVISHGGVNIGEVIVPLITISLDN